MHEDSDVEMIEADQFACVLAIKFGYRVVLQLQCIEKLNRIMRTQ